ncbi:MAG: hypothetical protein WCL11_19600, partial [Verrucomicrobiota bacterium]
RRTQLGIVFILVLHPHFITSRPSCLTIQAEPGSVPLAGVQPLRLEYLHHAPNGYFGPTHDCRSNTLFNLRSDPFEEADHIAMDYGHWRIDRLFLLVPAQQYVGQFLASFKEFPPSQKVGSFSLDQVLEELSAASTKNQ